jgi:TolB-like protein/Flp pilus assembly protein TadD
LSIFNELKRRNVFKVGIAYVVVAWLVAQVLQLVFESFGTPDWAIKTVLVLLATGLPFALFFAWAFEMTPEGLKREHEVDRSQSTVAQTGNKLNHLISALMALALAYFAYDKFMLSGDREAALIEATTQTVTEQAASVDIPTETDKSIAVLPFVNMSSDPEQEYFSDGISEELLNGLAKIESLQVAARTSSFSFKGQNLPVGEIAKVLGVGHILEGSVRKSGTQIRVTAQLIRASDGFHMWSETYDRELVNIFAIQDDISKAIVDALKISLKTGNGNLVETQTTNMEAYEALLQGRFEFQKRSINGGAVLDAIEFFWIATALDPNYAIAFAELGRALALSINYGVANNFERQVRLARLATDRALAIEPENFEAILSSAVIKFQFEAEFESAEKDFLHAIELSPNSPAAHNFYGDYLATVFDLNGAVETERRAALLNPQSRIDAGEYAEALMAAGREEEGLSAYETALARHPGDGFIMRSLAVSYSASGKTDEAHAIYNDFNPIQANTQENKQAYLHFLAAQGDEAALQQLLNSADNNGAAREFDYRDIANIYFELGRYDESAVWLDKLYKLGINYYQLQFSPITDPRNAVDHAGLNEILSRPGLAELMTIRRKNLELIEQTKR